MAGTTYTASTAQSGIQPKYDATGAQQVHVAYASAGHTLSDEILLCKIPNGALVTQVKGYIGTSNVDSVIKLGWKRASDGAGAGASETAFGTWTASSTTVNTEVDLATKFIAAVAISFTDTIGSDYAMVYVTNSVGSFTDTFSLDLTITYYNDHKEGYGS